MASWKPGRSTNYIDIQIARRLLARRLELQLSQQAVGEAVGVTMHKVQQYEIARNKISASKLLHLAKFLEVPVSYFFSEQAQSLDAPNDPELKLTLEWRALAEAFLRIPNRKLKRSIVDFVKKLAGT